MCYGGYQGAIAIEFQRTSKDFEGWDIAPGHRRISRSPLSREEEGGFQVEKGKYWIQCRHGRA
jgi:hypothetical protein